MVESKFFFLGMYLLQAFRIEFLVDRFFRFFCTVLDVSSIHRIYTLTVYILLDQAKGAKGVGTSATSVQKRK